MKRKLNKIYILFSILVSIFIFSSCTKENVDVYNYENNYKISFSDNKINIISNKNFKTAEFEINYIIYNDQVSDIEKDRLIKIKNNFKKNKTIIEINNKKKMIMKEEIIFSLIIDSDIEKIIDTLQIKLKQRSIIPTMMEKFLIYINFLFNNFGLSIIAITIIIKLIMLPLTLRMDKSMRNMKKLQPEVDKLKEKYKNDPNKLNTEMMKLWSDNNINPVGGCLPVFLQIPIFFALYSILKTDSLSNIIPSDTTFLYFNLTTPDKLYILPVLNGLILFFQQKIMKTNDDNLQMKMLQYTLPGMIFFISLNMPAGLQLYWLFSSLFSFAQQYYIVKLTEKE